MLKSYWDITKPRVTLLAVFCAVIGLLLSTDEWVPWQLILASASGIWLLAASGFAINCLAERTIDAKMTRTKWRPSAKGDLHASQIIPYALVLGTAGMLILYFYVNTLTMWLTFATFVGYAFIYTLWLKPATPQNIVIGGFFGAMPPLLGWTSYTNHIDPQAWLLVMIIFLWTPPHFWALALYRREDYAKSGLPMLPITHGQALTCLHIYLYTIALLAASLLPYLVGMSAWLYLGAALILGLVFVWKAWLLKRAYSDEMAKKVFKYSLIYLSLLFFVLLLDHYVLPQYRHATTIWVEM